MIFGQKMSALPIDWKQRACLGRCFFIHLDGSNVSSFSLTYRCPVSSISKVHITQQTLALLEDQYFFEPGTEMAKKDPVLIKNNIETFLISPQFYFGSDSQVSFVLMLFAYLCW